MLLSLFTLINLTLTQVLFLESFTSTILTTAEDWQFFNPATSLPITQCGGEYIIGGFEQFGMFSAATRFIELPPHYKIRIEFEVYIIDTWDLIPGEYLKVFVDEQTVFKQQYACQYGVINYCGQSGNNRNDQLYQIIIESYHNSRTAFIELTSTLDSIPFDESWGFRNFRLFIFLCPSGCLTCTYESTQVECLSWVIALSSYTIIDQNQFTTDGWNIVGGITTKQICSTIPTVCGYNACGMSTTIQTQLTLPFHSRILIKFKYLKFDTWKITDHAYLKVDGIIKWNQLLSLYNQYQTSVCGSSATDIFVGVELRIPHSKLQTTISFENSLDQSNAIESFGLRDIQIFIQQSICGDGVIQLEEECDDGNISPFDGCFQCQYSCVDGCKICNYGICLSCYDGWTYEKTQNFCQKNLIFFTIDNRQICDFDQNFLMPVQVYDSYNQHLDNGCQFNKFACDKNCKQCIQNECIYCNDGYKLNEFYQCKSICGDNLITQEEECDTQNENCIQCKLTCGQYCLKCNFGQCLICQSGYELFDNQICNEIIDVISENDSFCQSSCSLCLEGKCLQCQSGYQLILDYCQEICGSSELAIYTLEECICDQQCSDCKYNTCYQCNSNYQLYQNQCLNICGNGIVQENEECDDGNNIQYDGCYNCLYQCSLNCMNCIQGICQDICQYGYYYINDQCNTICGDQIKAGNEQCDDGNQDTSDGCYQCEYYCPINCSNCFEGICQECDQGFTLQDNYCLTICGDGILSIKEECDDNNVIDGDGCSSVCKIEKNWICKYGFECNYVVYPQMIVKFLVQKNQYQYVEMYFSQEVLLKEDINFTQMIELSILDVNNSLYNYTIMEVQAAQYQVSTFVEYIFQIEIHTTLDYQPMLIVQLKKQLFNDQDAPLNSQNSFIQLQQPNYITQEETKIAGTFKTINEASVKSLCAFTLFLMLLGNALSFWGILDALQQQSYLRFINVLYPQTLMIYFESSEIVSVQPALDYITLYKNEGKFFQFPYLQSYEKFQFYQINADIGQNIRAIILVFVSLFSSIIGTYIGLILLIKLEQFGFVQKIPKLTRLIQKLRWKIIKLNKQLIQVGIKNTLKASSWDLIFMSLLQIKADLYYTKPRDYVCKFLAIFILSSGSLLVIRKMYGIKTWKRESFQQFWRDKFDMFQILKKFMVLYILVFQQQQQECQTIILTAIGVFYLIYITKFKVFESQQEQVKSIIMEISVTVFTASTFLNWNLASRYLKYDEKITISWVQMSILAVVLIQFMLIEIYYTINQLIIKMKEAKRKKEEKEEKMNKKMQENNIQRNNSSKTIGQNSQRAEQQQKKKTIFSRAKYSSRVSPIKFVN